MAYDPAELKLPAWLLLLLDRLICVSLPLFPCWKLSFSRPGVVFVAGLIGVWAAALYSGNNLLYLCGAMLLALLWVGLWQGVQLLGRVVLPVFPQLQAASVYVMRRQQEGLFSSPCSGMVQLEGLFGREKLKLNALCYGDTLLWYGRFRIQDRGLYPCRQLQLTTAAPLGLFFVRCLRQVTLELVVLPLPIAWFPQFHSPDNHDSKTPGDAWHDLRAYIAGDSPKLIHWRKAQAEPDSWSVKRFTSSDGIQHHHCLKLDLRLPAGMPLVAFEKLMGQAWFWLKKQSGSKHAQLYIGSQRYDLCHDADYQQAVHALAMAEPGLGGIAAVDGVILSLCNDAA
ncbi:MAG: hypothetical protein Q9M31_08160 [Mariprofundus sp.]|nr:hypothetical protein [Mariprofundus sp.]